MSNQAEPRQDAAKRRREYLRKKVGTYARAALATGFCIVSIAYLWSPVEMSYYERNIAPAPNRAEYLCTLITNGFYFLGPKWPSYSGAAILILVLALIIIAVSVVNCGKQMLVASRVAYVPPVREQIANLPAEAILVRGSDQPAAAPGELLRAARAGEVADEAGELLRTKT